MGVVDAGDGKMIPYLTLEQCFPMWGVIFECVGGNFQYSLEQFRELRCICHLYRQYSKGNTDEKKD